MENRISPEMARNISGIQQQNPSQRQERSQEVAIRPDPVAGAPRSESERGGETAEDMDAMVEEIREMARMFERDLEFRIEEDLDRTVVEVKDTQQDEVIRQIPSEQMLELARNMERIRGILFDESA